MDVSSLTGLASLFRSEDIPEQGLTTKIEGQSIYEVVYNLESTVSHPNLEDSLIESIELDAGLSKVTAIHTFLFQSYMGLEKLSARLQYKLSKLRVEIAHVKGFFACITTLFMRIRAMAYSSLIHRLDQVKVKLSQKVVKLKNRLDPVKATIVLKGLGYKYGKVVTKELLDGLVQYLAKHNASPDTLNEHILGYLRETFPHATFEAPEKGYINFVLFKAWVERATQPKAPALPPQPVAAAKPSLIVATFEGTLISLDQAKKILKDLGYRQPTMDALALHLVKKEFRLRDVDLGMSQQEKLSFNTFVVDFLLTQYPEAREVARAAKNRWFAKSHATMVRIITGEEFQGLTLEFKHADLGLNDHEITPSGLALLQEGARLQEQAKQRELEMARIRERSLAAPAPSNPVPKKGPASQRMNGPSAQPVPAAARSTVRKPTSISQAQRQITPQPTTKAAGGPTLSDRAERAMDALVNGFFDLFEGSRTAQPSQQPTRATAQSSRSTVMANDLYVI